jgi:DNA-binding beta-propeller fold protein YncE
MMGRATFRLWLALLASAIVATGATQARAQVLDNPYRMVENWAKMPPGRGMGAPGKLLMAPDGNSIWAIVRCDAPGEPIYRSPSSFRGTRGRECVDSTLDPILQFDLDGNVIASFGGGLFIWPHGLGIDPDGNIWVSDGAASANIPAGDTRGHQVIKFSPQGKVLARIGTPGVAGGGKDHLTSPSDVAFAPGGDVFIGDGHYRDGNNRIVRFTKDGKYVSEWGKAGTGPGEFDQIHALETDAAGRLYVADRGNNRVQIFQPDGTYVASWTQFGRPSGIFITGDTIYVADSESDNAENPGYDVGIRIGEIRTGWVRYFIPYPWSNPNLPYGTGAEFVAVDRDGNIYGGEPIPRNIQKYVRVRP